MKPARHKFTFQAMTGLKRWLLLPLAPACLCGAWGNTLSDPTLPPPEWLATQPGAPGALAPADQGPKPGLQLILIGRSRKFAVIDGQVVRPGDSFDGSKVLDIKPGKVVVQDPSKSLRLTPSVEKKVIRSAPPEKAEGKPSKNKGSLNRDGGTQ